MIAEVPELPLCADAIPGRFRLLYAIDVSTPLTYHTNVIIKETSLFTKRVRQLLDGESYRLLQLRLVADPGAGTLIKGTGGLREIRWEGSGRGKRGGVRVVYYWATRNNIILMLMIYGKNERDDLAAEQRKVLRQLVKEEFK